MKMKSLIGAASNRGKTPGAALVVFSDMVWCIGPERAHLFSPPGLSG
ncbi:MAG: hypothetical protein ACI8R4_000732, partial [Paracoccaceae bacterium]